jgi:hypothetical protein
MTTSERADIPTEAFVHPGDVPFTLADARLIRAAVLGPDATSDTLTPSTVAESVDPQTFRLGYQPGPLTPTDVVAWRALQVRADRTHRHAVLSRLNPDIR